MCEVSFNQRLMQFYATSPIESYLDSSHIEFFLLLLTSFPQDINSFTFHISAQYHRRLNVFMGKQISDAK